MNDDHRRRGPQRLGAILPDVHRKCGLERRARERDLLEDWPEIVGEKIAGHSRPVDIRDGVLWLTVDHAAWRQELTLLQPEIIRRLNERHGEGTVVEIRWRHGGSR